MSRENILNRISKITDNNSSSDPHDLARLRLKNHPQNLIPDRAKKDKNQLLFLFSNEAKRVAATVSHISSSDLVPNEVARYLKDQNLSPIIKYAPILDSLPWSSTLLKGIGGTAEETDAVGVTYAFAGVAETGTVVVSSGPGCPTLLNFLPITNIVVIEAEKILGTYEDIWNYMRNTNFSGDKKPGFMPRTLNMITGPSRTADIEQTLLLGIHGPKRLHIVIVDHAFT